MKTEISTYEQDANTFLSNLGASMTATFLRHDKHFQDDKEKRDIYEVVFTRPDRFPFKIVFGQSINNSGKFTLAKYLQKDFGGYCLHDTKEDKAKLNKAVQRVQGYTFPKMGADYFRNENFKSPSAYDVLACITKNDPGTFEDFCNEFGYDTDSRKAEKTYYAVLAEWNSAKAFFSPEELIEMHEIN